MMKLFFSLHHGYVIRIEKPHSGQYSSSNIVNFASESHYIEICYYPQSLQCYFAFHSDFYDQTSGLIYQRNSSGNHQCFLQCAARQGSFKKEPHSLI